MSCSNRGATLSEVLIGSVIFGMMLGVLFFIYRTAASAWMKGDTRTDLLRQAQVISGHLTADVERSIYESLSISADRRGVAVLSAIDDQGDFVYDALTRSARWQRYRIYWFESSDSSFYEKELSVVGTAQEVTPAKIETFSGATLESHFSNGRALARDLSECQFFWNPNGLLSVSLDFSRKRAHSEKPETYKLDLMMAIRNFN